MLKKPLELYKITDEEIIPTENITYEDTVLVLDNEERNIYIYRGYYSRSYDEFSAKKLYERIINRFLNPNIYLIRTLAKHPDDSEKISQVKNFLIDKLPDFRRFKIKYRLKQLILLKEIREEIRQFKNYENSSKWQSKLSNLSNLWRLTVFNSITLGIMMIILFWRILGALNNSFYINSDGTVDWSLYNIWRENIEFIISILGMFGLISLIVNLIFFLFPMKVPIIYEKIDKTSLMTQSKPTSHARREEGLEIGPKISVPKPKLPPIGAVKAAQSRTSQTEEKQSNAKKAEALKKGGLKVPNMNIMKPPKPKVSEEDLAIPPPPIKKPITIEIDREKLEELAKRETSEWKYILVECKLCGPEPIVMPVPKKVIENAKEPVVDISYVHGDPPHVVVAQLDHDFQVRRRRASWVVFENQDK